MQEVREQGAVLVVVIIVVGVVVTGVVVIAYSTYPLFILSHM